VKTAPRKTAKFQKLKFVKAKISEPVKEDKPKKSKEFVKPQFSGFQFCNVCGCSGHKAAECLLRFTPNAKGTKNPKAKQVWVVKGC
jgi:hypothetical protein